MILTREKLEELENSRLAPYAVHSAHTKGRAYPEDEAPYRTVFQRDRDRVLHTTAFRRLEYKTQVFINHEGDYYRTRLTHTLEVAQIGRTIARALAANEDLVEVISLAHDLGHPPFGHCGETVLNELMADEGGFDHNKQSLRIVTTLEKRYPDFPGLNLTWEVREGIVKHETEYDISDASDYNPHLRGFLEAQITNIADELAYIAHDLDDGLRAKMITPLDLKDIAIWQVLLDQLQMRQTPSPLDDLSRHRLIRRLIGLEVTDVLTQAEKRLNQSNVQSVLALQSLPYPILEFSESFTQYNRQLKDFLFQRLYRHYHVNRTAVKSERIIKALFEAYWQEPGILPPHIIAQAETQHLKRVICDYIAGMTDRFAIQEYQRIFDPLTRA